MARLLTILGDDRAVCNDDNGPSELGLKMVNHGSADLSEGSKGSERDSDEYILGCGTISSSVFNFFSRVEHQLFDLSQVFGLTLLVGNERLGDNFLEFCVLGTLLNVRFLKLYLRSS